MAPELQPPSPNSSMPQRGYRPDFKRMIIPSQTPAPSVRVNVVVPVFNKRPLLERALGSVFDAVARYGAADVTLVDNGSTDGSHELMIDRFGTRATILRLPDATIGALRNHGARLGSAEYISFLDCDCLVPSDYFATLVTVFEQTGAAAAGRRIVLPPTPTWVEAAWDHMHQDGRGGERTWINSANLAVRRVAFEHARGFDESLVTGEDAELCQRLIADGGRVMQDQRLAVAHLDNAKTLAAFYRKERWRGLGMFGTVSRTAIDKPTTMTFLHLVMMFAALGAVAVAPTGWPLRIVIAAILLTIVPLTTVVYRRRSSVYPFNFVHAVVLYELYYLGRINALVLILTRGARAPRRPASAPRTPASLGAPSAQANR